METTTATYQITVKTTAGTLSFMRTMPTKPKTEKGLRSHKTRLENYAKKQYPNWKEVKVTSL